METFLHSAKLHLTQLRRGDRVHLVMGNEACDMDSVVSSLVYAYFIHKANRRPNTVVLPVLNIHNREFYLRCDVNRFLKEVNICPELLVFRDNIDLKMMKDVHSLTLTLVDHNILSREDRELQPLVDEIIDHHNRELEFDQNTCQVTIERVGSTCTLVGEKIFKDLPTLIDSNIALLLYGTILLDTYCLSTEAKRVTPKDKDIVDKLEAILKNTDRVKLFNKLQNWKNDISGLSLTDLLRKDVKVISNNTMRIAVSSVPILLEEMFNETSAEQELKKFTQETGCQILVTMGIRVDTNQVVRQIAVYSEHQSYLEQIAELLEDASLKGPTLRLSAIPSAISTLTLYQQGNIACSRKTVLPLLNSFLGGRLPILNIGGGCSSNNCDGTNNPAHNRRPTPEGRNDEDEVINFDPLAAESEDVVIESVTTHLHVLGIGDPISHAGSSQSSSNQNSCPYTPQNSCTDGGLEQDPYARQILPSFNSREMMEKIESKRGKLRGYVGGDGEGELSTASYPFTPKNSFVDGNFENYIRDANTSNFDTGEFMIQVNDRVARFTAKRTEPDGAGSSLPEVKKSTQNGSLAGELHGRNENDTLIPERNPEGKDNDNANCPEGTSLSEKLDKSDYKMDTSETSTSSEKTSPIMDCLQIATATQDPLSITTFTNDNITMPSTKSTDKNPPKQTTELCDTNHVISTTGNSRTESCTSMSSFHDDIDLPSNYFTETVDFPDSPHQLKLMQRSGNGIQNVMDEQTEKEDTSWMDQHEDDMLRNVLSPEGDDLKVKKERPISLFTPGKKKRKIKVNPDIFNVGDDHDDKIASPISSRIQESTVYYPITPCEFNLNPSRIEWIKSPLNDSQKIELTPERPSSLTASGKKKRKIRVNPDILNTSDDHDDKSLSSLSNHSDGDILSPSLDDIVTPDDIATPDGFDDSIFSPRELLPELSASEERDDERRWRTCVISGVQQKIDMKVIEPYKKVLSHGGYFGPQRSAIIVFCACYLPDHGRKDYDYVMDHLFLYVLTTLDQLVAEDYILVYLHGALERTNMPTFGWLKRCYTLIDRRLRKNLKGLYLVHPTFWLKTIVLMTKPFVSTKFARKLQFVNSLQELFELLPLDQMAIPDKVKQLDFKMMIRQKKKHHKNDSNPPSQVKGSENRSSEISNREIDTEAPYRIANSESEEFTGGWL